jgi:DNA polymerase III delta prime subunit
MPLPIIFVSSNQTNIDQAIEKYLSELDLSLDHSDVLHLSEKLGIDQIKKINQHFLWKNITKSGRVLVLNPADGLTLDAQNGLLKILEEAAESSHLIMGVSDESILIPTVLSRCKIINLSLTSPVQEDLSEIKLLLASSIENRLEQVEKKEDRKQIVEQICQFYYMNLPKEPELAESIKVVLNCIAWIKQNVSAKAVSDYLLIKLPIYQK